MSKTLTERQKAFLDAYRVHGKVKPAAEQAGCSRELHYGAMRTSETYRQEFSLVQQRLADELEEAMWQRAVYGVKIPKFYRGKVIGYDIRYSDTLLMRLLEANDPEKFGGIRKELQEQDRDAGFCVRWDRDEVGRPTLPRMTGPQPPAPPRPPRPPVPSIRELGIPVTYAEWAAARGITGRADCGPVDQEKIQRWAAGEDFGSVEWVREDVATDLPGDEEDADLSEQTISETDGRESDDSDVGFCVRSRRDDDESDSSVFAPERQGSSGRGNRVVSPPRASSPVSRTAVRLRPSRVGLAPGSPARDGRRWTQATWDIQSPKILKAERPLSLGRFCVRKRLRRGQGRAPAPQHAMPRPLSHGRRLPFDHALGRVCHGFRERGPPPLALWRIDMHAAVHCSPGSAPHLVRA